MQTELNEYLRQISGSTKFDCIELVNTDISRVMVDLSQLLKNDNNHKLFDIERIIIRRCRLDNNSLESYRTIVNVSEHLNTAIFIGDKMDTFQAAMYIHALHDMPLTSLVFKERWLSDEEDLSVLLKVICKKKHIQSLDLSLDWLGDKGIVLLSKQLQAMTHLFHLNISCNDFNKIGLKTFVRYVAQHPSLTSLDLSYNHISADNAKYIETFLAKNDVLTELNLQSNCLQDDGVDHLIHALGKNHSLKILNICDNQITGRQLTKLIHSVIDFKNIEKINISHNRIDNNTLHNLIEFISEKNSKLILIT